MQQLITRMHEHACVHACTCMQLVSILPVPAKSALLRWENTLESGVENERLTIVHKSGSQEHVHVVLYRSSIYVPGWLLATSHYDGVASCRERQFYCTTILCICVYTIHINDPVTVTTRKWWCTGVWTNRHTSTARCYRPSCKSAQLQSSVY